MWDSIMNLTALKKIISKKKKKATIANNGFYKISRKYVIIKKPGIFKFQVLYS
jgi:hypothetical protein